MYCIIRNGKYINFSPLPILEYYNKKQITGEFWNGAAYQSITFEPEINDLEYHRIFKFENLTFRGTIEYRSSCCQPIADSMTVAAFHMGLVTVLDQLKKLLDKNQVLSNNCFKISELRKYFCKGEVPEFIDENELQSLILSLLDLAHTGLDSRGFGEAHFLEPLYDRAKRRTNPARDYLNGIAHDVPVKALVLQYAVIN